MRTSRSARFERGLGRRGRLAGGADPAGWAPACRATLDLPGPVHSASCLPCHAFTAGCTTRKRVPRFPAPGRVSGPAGARRRSASSWRSRRARRDRHASPRTPRRTRHDRAPRPRRARDGRRQASRAAPCESSGGRPPHRASGVGAAPSGPLPAAAMAAALDRGHRAVGAAMDHDRGNAQRTGGRRRSRPSPAKAEGMSEAVPEPSPEWMPAEATEVGPKARPSPPPIAPPAESPAT